MSVSAKRKIYLASSWRNQEQAKLLALLRYAGHEVYDFKNPRPGDNGFSWREIDDGAPGVWDAEDYRKALEHPAAERGFANDFDAMKAADTCVLLLPCGRSAHLEIGWMIASGRECFVLMYKLDEPELMYKLGAQIALSDTELLRALDKPLRQITLRRMAIQHQVDALENEMRAILREPKGGA